jgi:Protein of unknown function (DUF1493)
LKTGVSDFSKNTWNELLQFVRQFTSLPESFVLTRQTNLVNDLGLDGDDADEFMAAYTKHFNVEAGDFQYSDYFGPEGFDLIGDLIGKKPPLKPLTLGMLETAANMGGGNKRLSK